MRAFLLLPCVILASSCVLGPEPGNPKSPIPDSIRGDTAPHGASFGDRSWRKAFTDPTLTTLIERALKHNPDLVAASYRIEEARALEGVARAAWFPAINGSASTTTRYSSRNMRQASLTGDRRSEVYDLTALLSWEADLWGGIRRSNQAARATLLESEYRRDAVQTSLIASVASAYIELKNLDERLAISRSTVESRKASLNLVTHRRDGGVSSDLEVNQAAALLGEAEVSIPVTELASAAKENEIRALLGEYPGAVTRRGNLGQLDSVLRINGGLPSSLLERRSDVGAANQAYQAATANIGVAEALRLPSLSLTGNGGVVSADLDKLLQGKSANYFITPQLVGPLFDAGRSRSVANAAKARAQQTLADYQKTSQQAFREAADSLKAFVKTAEITTQLRQLVASQKNVSTIAQDRFQGGSSSYLEVLDAERSLFTSELDLADARRDHLLSVVQAYRALGGGWK